ncbi:MAG: cytochrome c family protein [Gammaproteobacteria bacterium]|jgi:cytochrome c|nr:cytochrome c family protein [Gammaproteobacteria bacterium]
MSITLRGFASALLLVLSAGAVQADEPPAAGNPARGKLLFLQCAACHDLKPAAVAKVGPNLNGVLGRKAGSVPGLASSPALKDSGIVWTEELLDKWIEMPGKLVPGTAMAFAGVAKPADRAALIAYLRQETAVATPAP